jgi:hypothetical protein
MRSSILLKTMTYIGTFRHQPEADQNIHDVRKEVGGYNIRIPKNSRNY